MIMASDVIRIGRRRAVAPRIADLTMLTPDCRRSSANCTMRMAFLARQTDEHDQCDLQMDIVVNSHYPGEDECSHESERNGKDHGPGKHMALILRRQEQIDE